MAKEGGVEQTLGSQLEVGRSEGQTKVGGGRCVAVVVQSRRRHLVDSYLVE